MGWLQVRVLLRPQGRIAQLVEHSISVADLISGAHWSCRSPLYEGRDMSKFNKTTTRTAVSSPVQSEPAATNTTYEGAPGFSRDEKSELFLLAVSNMVGEST